jgi:hypothetical protein
MGTWLVRYGDDICTFQRSFVCILMIDEGFSVRVLI